jgi:hypothetical protein
MQEFHCISISWLNLQRSSLLIKLFIPFIHSDITYLGPSILLTTGRFLNKLDRILAIFQIEIKIVLFFSHFLLFFIQALREFSYSLMSWKYAWNYLLWTTVCVTSMVCLPHWPMMENGRDSAIQPSMTMSLKLTLLLTNSLKLCLL